MSAPLTPEQRDRVRRVFADQQLEDREWLRSLRDAERRSRMALVAGRAMPSEPRFPPRRDPA